MATTSGSPKIPRRKVLHLLAAVPAAAAVGGSALAQEKGDFGKLDELAEGKVEDLGREPKQKVSAEATCIADSQGDLSRKERRALRDKMAGLEGALKTLRDYEIADEVEPAFLFRAIAPAGSGGGRG